MTDFSGPSNGGFARVLLILVLPAGVLVAKIRHQVEGDRLPDLPVVVGIVAGVTLLAVFGFLVMGRLVESNGQRQGARVVAIWGATPGFLRYLDARKPFLGDLSGAPTRSGAFLADDRGIRLGGYSRPDGVSWSWEHVRGLELGRARAVTGLASDVLLVSVESPDGVDIVPVAVNPSIYAPRSSSRARERFLTRLQALRREALSSEESDPVAP